MTKSELLSSGYHIKPFRRSQWGTHCNIWQGDYCPRNQLLLDSHLSALRSTVVGNRLSRALDTARGHACSDAEPPRLCRRRASRCRHGIIAPG